MDPKGYATNSQGIHGYVSVMNTLKFTYFLIKGTFNILLKIIMELPH
jgi:hypothetical protein